MADVFPPFGRPRLYPERGRASITVVLSTTYARRLREEADAIGVSLSTYMRQVLEAHWQEGP